MKLYTLTSNEKLQSISSGQIIPAVAFAYDEATQMALIIYKNDSATMLPAGDICYDNLSKDVVCTDIESVESDGQCFNISGAELGMILDGDLTLDEIKENNI